MKSNVAQSAIIKNIVDQLRPYKKGVSRSHVLAAVQHEIDVLSKFAPLWERLNDRPAIKKHAKKLDAALGEVEKLLASAPDMLAVTLFDPLRPDGAVMSPEEIELAYRARRGLLLAELGRLRKDCGRKFGIDPRKNTIAENCAWFARGMMVELSDNPIGSSTPQSKFRVITGLVYQAVSGCETPPDFERACDEAARSHRMLLV
jgi:hypothetical protein